MRANDVMHRCWVLWTYIPEFKGRALPIFAQARLRA
jgi:hypothetical protein